MRSLAELACRPCRGGEPPLSDLEIQELSPLVPNWEIVQREGIVRLERVFKFKDFAQALVFTNQVAEIAETEDHHPAILTEWGQVTVTWWTHIIRGLHRNDFILAARTDQYYASQTP
jgi:4a-hydroxytetrahydrobiopterin dehydratase